MSSVNIPQTIINNAHRWANMNIRPEKLHMAQGAASAIQKNQARYQTVAAQTHVPWYVIGVIHYREASLNFNTHLSNGDPLHSVTRDVPRGEKAFATWEEGAYDALVNYPPKLANWRDWSIGGLLTGITEYNGWGYDEMHMPSPYIWAGTDQYVRGMYVDDHKFSHTAVDPRVGAAAIIKCLGVITETPPEAPAVQLQPPSQVVPPKDQSSWTLSNLWDRIF